MRRFSIESSWIDKREWCGSWVYDNENFSAYLHCAHNAREYHISAKSAQELLDLLEKPRCVTREVVVSTESEKRLLAVIYDNAECYPETRSVTFYSQAGATVMAVFACDVRLTRELVKFLKSCLPEPAFKPCFGLDCCTA